MNPIALAMVLGLEFGPTTADSDGADLSGSLDAIESGAWSLAPYSGPLVQPYLRRSFGRTHVGLAPGAKWRRFSATSLDGRDGTVQVVQWSAEGRIWWQPDLEKGWILGMDAGYSTGSARLDGEQVAAGTPRMHAHPSVGHMGALSENWVLVGRAMWVMSWTDDSVGQGPGGAVGVEWRR